MFLSWHYLYTYLLMCDHVSVQHQLLNLLMHLHLPPCLRVSFHLPVCVCLVPLFSVCLFFIHLFMLWVCPHCLWLVYLFLRFVCPLCFFLLLVPPPCFSVSFVWYMINIATVMNLTLIKTKLFYGRIFKQDKCYCVTFMLVLALFYWYFSANWHSID